MEPVLDLPPLPDQQTAVVPDAVTAPAAAILTPAQSYAHNHPPYAEMIRAAISALKEPNGSSKKAIAKYIGDHYTDLPSTHEALLTHHLKQLKINGQLLMVKYSYKLPGSAPPPIPAPINGAVNAVSPDPASKRRPGRPPKPKPMPDAAQVVVPVFHPDTNSIQFGTEPHPQPYVASGPINGQEAAVVKPLRGRGRPPKLHGLKRQPGRPPKAGGTSGGVAIGRGRPRLAAPPVQVRKGSGRPRGRPPKPINVVQGLGLGVGVPGSGVPAGLGVTATVSGGVGPMKRGRGRPPKAGGVAKRARNLSAVRPKKLRKLSGKPVGRPKKVRTLNSFHKNYQ
ncbi:winged-helix DNA-binding transcription factor family protein [Striga hermonthica]|uniref:Winged-helix DNA-binding transcription factor family protein n=1 Tax=Striga hermonthica TaxID=68872 RepID=A0A9N7R4Y9_STRHE|nr:winged-helix DNA-binding transcription factor family protein [Striga hermonthica]